MKILLIKVVLITTLISIIPIITTPFDGFRVLNNCKIEKIQYISRNILLNDRNNGICSNIEVETPLTGNYLYAFPPYPLPSKGNVNTVIYWDTKLDINKAEMSVYNMDCEKICGKERISLAKLNDYNGIVTWNGFGYQSGIYLLVIKHGTRTVLIKMIIE